MVHVSLVVDCVCGIHVSVEFLRNGEIASGKEGSYILFDCGRDFVLFSGILLYF